MSTSWGSIASRFWANLVPALLLAARVAAQEPEPVYFYLSNQGFVLPQEVPQVHLSGRNLGEVEFRVYHIEDPSAFFRAQPNLHSPRPVAVASALGDKASVRESLREVSERAARGYRDLARALLSEDLRTHLAAELEIGTAPEPERAASGRGEDSLSLLTNYPLRRRFKHALKSENPQWWTSENIPLFETPAPVGAYLVEAVTGGKRAYTVSLVTNLRYVAKQGPSSEDKLLAFVTEANTGLPVGGARVAAISEEGPATVVEASTGPDGIAYLPSLRDSQSLLVSKGDDFLLGQAYFYFAAEDWETEPSSRGRRGRVYIYTDRPVYRPGHQVFLKALLRSMDRQGLYQVAGGSGVTVRATDPMNRKIYEAELGANDSGSLEASFHLAAEASLGQYSIELLWDERTYYGHFRVEEYKKPEFEVTVGFDRPSYVAGDPMSVEVQATYYFGDPVAGGQLAYEIYQADYYRPWWEAYDLKWFFAGEEGYATYNYELVEQGEGRLDDQGRAKLTVPTVGREHDALVRVVARVTDPSNREIAGARLVPVSAGTFRIELDSDRYANAAGQPLEVRIRTISLEGEPVSARLEVDVIRRAWEHGQTREEKLSTAGVETDASGLATFRFTPEEPGSYRVDVRATDGRGNRLRRDYGFWVWSEKPWWSQPSGGSLTLTADRRTYSPSDTARLLLVSPFENPTVLFTVEGPSLFEHRVVSVQGTTASIPVPLKEAYSPNVYVTATAVSGGQFFEQSEVLVIPPQGRFLKVDIRTDKRAYLPGEEVQLEVAVRDERGRPADAELSIGIVDQAVYAITPEMTPDIRSFFYGKRPNDVRTNLSTGYYMYSSASARALTSVRAPDWADFKTVAETRVRKEFKDTMFWQAIVRSGSSGVVRLPAKTPDNLTTWRITVRAADRQTRVGQETATFLSRKELMVRLGLPRFFRVRDSGQIRATVHNSQERAAAVRVKMEAVGIDLKSPLDRTLALAPQSSETLSWDFEATRPGAARFTAYALSEGKSDAEQIEVPILPHGLETTDSTTAFLDQDEAVSRLDLEIPDGAERESFQARLSLSPSLAGPVFSSLDYLVGYPYGCVEQTMSSFLPTVMVSRTLSELGIEAPARGGKLAEVPQMVERGLARLYNLQHGDGGWGWWENDATHPFMTAYVLYGLAQARENGFAVDPAVYDRGRQAAVAQLGKDKVDLSTRSYLLYALALGGSQDRTMVEKLFARRGELAKEMNDTTRALLARTLMLNGMEAEAREVLDELVARARRVDGYAYWEGVDWHYDWQNDSLLTTAGTLAAILAIDPDRPEAVAAVRWLMSRRRGDGWRSTLDTAQILYTLAQYLKARREFLADFEVEVRLGSRTVLRRRFTREDLFQESVELRLRAEDLAAGSAIEIRKRGRGNLYGTLIRSYYTEDEDIPPKRSSALAVERQYYRLTLGRGPEGKPSYRRTPLRSGDAVGAGDLVLAVLTPSAAADAEYLMIEDPLPSGFTVIEDTRGWRIEGVPYQEYEPYGWGYWYDHREVRDNRVAFFSSYFDGRNRPNVHYVLRAEAPGDYHVMPARIELMYYPETRATTREMTIRVRSQ